MMPCPDRKHGFLSGQDIKPSDAGRRVPQRAPNEIIEGEGLSRDDKKL